MVLIVTGVWLLHPFMTGRMIGTGDALWYANMLADFVTQWRSGVFPVFAGQTEFAFNGAVYPLRVAPLYQHLAGCIDLLTGRQLGFFALQHATVIVCGFAGLATAYLTGIRLAPERRWLACGAALLYLGCPGVLGTVYTQDLYMTWMTVPFLPLAVYGTLRPFRCDDARSQFWLAAPLAALWYAHSPIALWASLIAAGFQSARLLLVHRTVVAWKRACVGGVVFVGLALYPFISVAALNVPGTTSTVTTGLTEQERITNVIREVFPAVLQPLSEAAGALSDLQLGYALWLVLVVVLVAAWRQGGPIELRLLTVSCLMLLVLLLPVPGLTDWLWAHLPEQIKRITFYWPMHRFYLLLAALLSTGGLIALNIFWAPLGRARLALVGLLILGCAWTVWETRQFGRAGRLRTATTELTARSQRPENLLLMNHAYGLFPALPRYFSNGVMDPRAELRLLAGESGPVLPDPTDAPPESWMRGVADANPGILKLSPTLRLEPGRRYRLVLGFPPDREVRGVLQLLGRAFFREYVLPSSGQPFAFGSAPANSQALSLWTSDSVPEEITVRFIPTAPGAKPADFADFARYRLQEVAPSTTSVELNSLMPLRATVRAPAGGAWLETPRMFLPGYLAEINGRPVPVGRSATGLAGMPVPAGTSQVTLTYRAPWPVRAAYWAALLAWTALLTLAGATTWRRAATVTPN